MTEEKEYNSLTAIHTNQTYFLVGVTVGLIISTIVYVFLSGR